MTNPHPKGSTLAWCYSNGSRQSYYRRSPKPFFYTQDSVLNGLEVHDLSTEEQTAFAHGYQDNTDFKDWD